MTTPCRCAIIPKYVKSVSAALAQPDRVPGYEPVGRGFESLMPRHKKSPRLVRGLFLCHSMGGFEAPSATRKALQNGVRIFAAERVKLACKRQGEKSSPQAKIPTRCKAPALCGGFSYVTVWVASKPPLQRGRRCRMGCAFSPQSARGLLVSGKAKNLRRRRKSRHIIKDRPCGGPFVMVH